jgi:hypothetical protein
MARKALSISILSSLPVVVFAYLAQYCSLRFAVNYYPLESLSFLFFTCLALSSIAIAKLQMDFSLKHCILKVFLPLFVGLFALTITSKLLFQVDLHPLSGFYSLFISQLGFQIYIVIGCWLLLFVLNRVLWKKTRPIVSAKLIAVAIVFILISTCVHSLCSYTSLAQMMGTHSLTQPVLPKYSFVGLLYGIQQGISFLTFVVAAVLYPTTT